MIFKRLFKRKIKTREKTVLETISKSEFKQRKPRKFYATIETKWTKNSFWAYYGTLYYGEKNLGLASGTWWSGLESVEKFLIGAAKEYSNGLEKFGSNLKIYKKLTTKIINEK